MAKYHKKDEFKAANPHQKPNKKQKVCRNKVFKNVKPQLFRHVFTIPFNFPLLTRGPLYYRTLEICLVCQMANTVLFQTSPLRINEILRNFITIFRIFSAKESRC